MSNSSKQASLLRKSVAQSVTYTTEITTSDVLFGRGAPIYNYAGNIRYRQLVQERKAKYASSCRRNVKKELAQEIITIITHTNGGRFLREVKTSAEASKLGVPEGTKAWVCVDKKTVMEKIKQALRDPNDPAGPLLGLEENQLPLQATDASLVEDPAPLSDNPSMTRRRSTCGALPKSVLSQPTASLSLHQMQASSVAYPPNASFASAFERPIPNSLGSSEIRTRRLPLGEATTLFPQPYFELRQNRLHLQTLFSMNLEERIAELRHQNVSRRSYTSQPPSINLHDGSVAFGVGIGLEGFGSRSTLSQTRFLPTNAALQGAAGPHGPPCSHQQSRIEVLDMPLPHQERCLDSNELDSRRNSLSMSRPQDVLTKATPIKGPSKRSFDRQVIPQHLELVNRQLQGQAYYSNAALPHNAGPHEHVYLQQTPRTEDLMMSLRNQERLLEMNKFRNLPNLFATSNRQDLLTGSSVLGGHFSNESLPANSRDNQVMPQHLTLVDRASQDEMNYSIAVSRLSAKDPATDNYISNRVEIAQRKTSSDAVAQPPTDKNESQQQDSEEDDSSAGKKRKAIVDVETRPRKKKFRPPKK